MVQYVYVGGIGNVVVLPNGALFGRIVGSAGWAVEHFAELWEIRGLSENPKHKKENINNLYHELYRLIKNVLMNTLFNCTIKLTY